jgi:hypothetical protein
MRHYRVTKYNPNLRSKDGAYRRHDWTSVFDVGKQFDGGILSVEDYLRTEDRYIDAIRISASLTNSVEFVVDGIECTCEPAQLPSGIREDSISMLRDFTAKEPGTFPLSTACVFARLALREVIWGRLASQSGLYVHFGYDFYMYIGHAGNQLEHLVLNDLYVEDFPSPYGEDSV